MARIGKHPANDDSHPPFVLFGSTSLRNRKKERRHRGENWNTRVERSRPFHRRVTEERGCGETVARAKLTRWRRRQRIHDAVGEYRRTVSRVRCIGQQVTLKVKQCEGTGETTARTAAETGSE